MSEYKTVRIKKEEYDKILKAKELLIRKGVDRIPKEVFRTCPECGELMDGVSLEHYTCPRCNYNETDFRIDWGSFTIGASLAVGALALIYILCKEPEKE